MPRGAKIVVLLVMALAVLPRSGRAQAKAPWEWTLDERLAERFDPVKIRERDEAYIAKYRTAHPELLTRRSPPPAGLQYRIDGARNPELFLPDELFDMLLRDCVSNASTRAHAREHLSAGLRRAGFDPDWFWSALESASAPYLPWLERQGGPSGREQHYEKCHARSIALEAARELFGPWQFDRMLYTVIAPESQFSAGTSSPNPSDDLRREANGCQESTAQK